MAMKKLTLLVTFTFFARSISFSQTLTENDVYNANSIIFYGYDFSDFQLADAKRMGQDLKKYLFNLVGFLQEHLPEKKLKKWLDKESVTFNLDPTMVILKKVNNDDIATASKHKIVKDSIPQMIKRYQLTDKSGIGYVIIFECFDSNEKRVSAYSVFFDIATKQPLLIEYVSKHDSNSFNRISDWNPAAFVTINKLTDLYIDKRPNKK